MDLLSVVRRLIESKNLNFSLYLPLKIYILFMFFLEYLW